MNKTDELVAKKQNRALLDTIANEYIHAATSDNTRRAYRADIEHFESAGGRLPATDKMIERYLLDSAHRHNPRTLSRRMTAIRQWHKIKGLSDPTDSPLVTKTMRGIARLHGKPKRQALALRLKDLDRMTEYLKEHESVINTRNRAMLLVGFFGAFRRSELMAITWEQVSFESDGMVIRLPRSKTDQAGDGQKVIIPFGNNNRCPVRALIDWRQASGQWSGLVFRWVSKTGNVMAKGISGFRLNRMLQNLAKDVGLANADQYSAHSLRRGFATEAARKGASMPAIQRHGRWKSTRTVIEYIEAGRQFSDSAVNCLFEF